MSAIACPLGTCFSENFVNILNHLPKDYKLYIKEHPMMSLRGWRSISEYNEIINLPNVKLFHPDLKSEFLIKNSLTKSTMKLVDEIEFKNLNLTFTLPLISGIMLSVFTFSRIAEHLFNNYKAQTITFISSFLIILYSFLNK